MKCISLSCYKTLLFSSTKLDITNSDRTSILWKYLADYQYAFIFIIEIQLVILLFSNPSGIQLIETKPILQAKTEFKEIIVFASIVI